MAGIVLGRCVSRTSLSALGGKGVRIRGTNLHYWTPLRRTAATALTVNNYDFYNTHWTMWLSFTFAYYFGFLTEFILWKNNGAIVKAFA